MTMSDSVFTTMQENEVQTSCLIFTLTLKQNLNFYGLLLRVQLTTNNKQDFTNRFLMFSHSKVQFKGVFSFTRVRSTMSSTHQQNHPLLPEPGRLSPTTC
jgi:hypothetical protein